MHSISVISGSITSTGFSGSRESQNHNQYSVSHGSVAKNNQDQNQRNGQQQAAIVNVDTDIGGNTPDSYESYASFTHLPAIFTSTTHVLGESGTENQQSQGLNQRAIVKENSYPGCFPYISRKGPLAKNQGDQDQASDQQSDSDVNINTKIGDPIEICAPVPPRDVSDPEVIVDDSISRSGTGNFQEQWADQHAEVKPQHILRRQPRDPAINELDQNQDANKRTNARNNTSISVGPGGRHDPYRIGVGPTSIFASRTLAEGRSVNRQNQGYNQAAVANSGYANEYADNSAKSAQNNDSDTASDNKLSILYRTNQPSPLYTEAYQHASLAEDTNEQSEHGQQAAAASGPSNKARNRGAGYQDNSQWTNARMTVNIDV
ncbi:MAG: hypothetical protein QGF00_12675 [Planctomycetota bacterium]|jgi:hypothetical protein|nr:hypothetical protein [Planctomycetota bacterium]MDP7250451.1 hypothetical protein [Planctomycetota bacterium]